MGDSLQESDLCQTRRCGPICSAPPALLGWGCRCEVRRDSRGWNPRLREQERKECWCASAECAVAKVYVYQKHKMLLSLETATTGTDRGGEPGCDGRFAGLDEEFQHVIIYAFSSREEIGGRPIRGVTKADILLVCGMAARRRGCRLDQVLMIFSRIAKRTRSCRVDMFSLSIMCWRWVLTVFMLINRSAATCLVDLPSASSCRISRSRSVRR